MRPLGCGRLGDSGRLWATVCWRVYCKRFAGRKESAFVLRRGRLMFALAKGSRLNDVVHFHLCSTCLIFHNDNVSPGENFVAKQDAVMVQSIAPPQHAATAQ